jgi:hypothetical protein
MPIDFDFSDFDFSGYNFEGKYIITGSGPRKLIQDSNQMTNVQVHLVYLLQEAKKRLGRNEELHVISGMAEGFDEALARAAIETNVPFTAAIPNIDYINYYWNKRSELGIDRTAQAEEIIGKAQSKIYVTGRKYGRASMEARNQWMFRAVEEFGGEALIYGDEKSLTGGTKNAYDFIKRQNIPHRMINPANIGRRKNNSNGIEFFASPRTSSCTSSCTSSRTSSCTFTHRGKKRGIII